MLNYLTTDCNHILPFGKRPFHKGFYKKSLKLNNITVFFCQKWIKLTLKLRNLIKKYTLHSLRNILLTSS